MVQDNPAFTDRPDRIRTGSLQQPRFNMGEEEEEQEEEELAVSTE